MLPFIFYGHAKALLTPEKVTTTQKEVASEFNPKQSSGKKLYSSVKQPTNSYKFIEKYIDKDIDIFVSAAYNDSELRK